MEINQNLTIDDSKLAQLLKHQSIVLNMDINSVEYEINRLENMRSKNNTDIRKKNISNTIKYLKLIKSVIKRGDVELTWDYNEDRGIFSSPFEMKSIESLNIMTTDYVIAGNKNIVCVGYQDVINAIALELAYRDFMYELRDIEGMLTDIGVLRPSNIQVLKDKGLLEDDMSTALMSYKIGDSPYVSTLDGRRFDYFGKDVGIGSHYREMMESSIKTVMKNILMNTIENTPVELKLCAIYDKEIYYMVEREDVNKACEAIEGDNVIVRVFGRRFESKPRVTVY